MLQEYTIKLIFVAFYINAVAGTGQLWMRLINFVNPNGKGNNGHFCDGKFFIRGSDCDHRINICIDNVHGSNSMGRCLYGRVSTGVIPNRNSMNFGSRAGNLRNPMTFGMNSWPGAVKIKVSVWDDDDNADDFVDFMKLIYTDTAGTTSSTRSVRLFIQNRVRMTVELKVYCDHLYYGSDCSTFCYARNDVFGHYTCDDATGNKICMDGWKGLDCNVRIDLCASNPCQNGANCHNGFNQYTCVCQDGFEGSNCENDINECNSNPCANGGSCIDLAGDFDCRCPEGWRGKDCTVNINECQHNPCAHGSSCMDTDGSFHCICTEGTTGKFCDADINECDSFPCQNNGTCNNSMGSFSCSCTDSYNGTFCHQDVNECEFGPCHGNATCINEMGSFRCNCPEGMNGKHCDQDINECDSNPCHGRATCHNTIGSFTCQCPPGMKGSNESVIYLDGALYLTTKEEFTEGIKTLYRDFGGLDKHNLKLIVNVEHIHLSSKHTITKIIVSASSEDTTLCGDLLSDILNKTDINKINALLPYPLYKYETKPRIGKLQTAVKYEEMHWISSNWYVIAISVMALVVVLAIVIMVLWRRRRKQKVYLDRNSNNNLPSISESDMQPVGPGFSPLSFDNELYAHYRPPENMGLMLNYCEEES